MNRGIVAAVILAIAYTTCLAQPACGSRDVENVAGAIDVLTKRSPSETDPDNRKCIEAAIAAVSQFRSAKAVPELIRYLEYRRSDKDKEPDTVLLHPYIEGHDYPAVVALSRIGAPARSLLLKVIKSRNTSVLERQNAAHAILLSFVHEPNGNPGDGIRFIREAEATTNAQSAEQMEQVIAYLLGTPACQRSAPKCDITNRR